MSARRRVYMLEDKFLEDVQMHIKAGRTVEVAGWVADAWIAEGAAEEFVSKKQIALEAKVAARKAEKGAGARETETGATEKTGNDHKLKGKKGDGSSKQYVRKVEHRLDAGGGRVSDEHGLGDNP